MENESNLTGSIMPPINTPAEPKAESAVPETRPVEPITPTTIAPNNFITPASVTTGSSKKSRFGLFVAIGIIIIVIIYGTVAYLYFQNKKKTGSTVTETNTAGTTQITKAPEFNSEYVKIIDGSVAYKPGSGEQQVLVNKTDYPGSGITGFLKLALSPDKTKICFESWSPAPKPSLYISEANGTNVKEVSPNRKNCTWAPDSKKILYTNYATGSAGSDIFAYGIDNSEEKNVSYDPNSNDQRNFEIVGLSADGGSLICSFSYINKEKEGGQCQINLSTLELSFTGI